MKGVWGLIFWNEVNKFLNLFPKSQKISKNLKKSQKISKNLEFWQKVSKNLKKFQKISKSFKKSWILTKLVTFFLTSRYNPLVCLIVIEHVFWAFRQLPFSYIHTANLFDYISASLTLLNSIYHQFTTIELFPNSIILLTIL